MFETNDDTVAGQVALETMDVLEALFPDVLSEEFRGNRLLLEKFSVHAHHERLLVVSAIEYSDTPTLRDALHAAPLVDRRPVSMLIGSSIKRLGPFSFALLSQPELAAR